MSIEVTEKLRNMWVSAETQELKDKIRAVAEAVKVNDRFGSVEYEGNGYCYTCYIEPARQGKFNCDKCARDQYSGRALLPSDEVVRRVKDMGKGR